MIVLLFLCFSLHWHTETRGKSTAMHCAILAPSSTRVIECTGLDEEIPDYEEEETVLLFPAEVKLLLFQISSSCIFLIDSYDHYI